MGKLHQDDVRAKIQASQLVNVLQDHALSTKKEDGSLKQPDISASRLKSIEILLRKSVADLSAITVSGDAENPLGLTHQLSATTLELLRDLSPSRADGGVSPSEPD